MVPVADGDVPHQSVPDAGPRHLALLAEITELEGLPRFDRDGAGARAARAVGEARDLGLTELELRAQLVTAEVLQRRGKLAEGGRIAQDVHKWATEHGCRYVLARSHYVLQAVFQELGDVSLALEHAVRAVDLLGENGPPPLRIDHLIRLADCLAESGDLEESRERYREVLRLTEDEGDVDRELVALNNWAYGEAVAEEHEAALALCERMRTLAVRHGIELHVGRLDTVARALMGLDRLAEAEEVLQPGVRPEVLSASPDGDAGTDSLLTLAEIQRRRARLPQAQANLDECVRLCDEFGLTAIRVRARREQAELHAAAGDYRAAFEEHKVYCSEAMHLQSAQRDARARAVQAMYETTEARRQSRRYRELSLRDPLTGLYNRRYVDEELPRLLRACADRAEVATIALLDLDHFKRVNDTCSHDVGDQVLRLVAGLLVSAAESVSGHDSGSFAARMGGEEFLLVLVGCDATSVAGHLEKVRRTIGTHPWQDLTGSVPVTISVGAATTDGVFENTPAALLSRADAHLYRAKSLGRDRVVGDLD